MDNWPKGLEHFCTTEELERVAPSMVIGVAKPFHQDFRTFLCNRFQEI